MVRHHTKKKRSDTQKFRVSEKQHDEKKRLEIRFENIDRFAGSSDEDGLLDDHGDAVCERIGGSDLGGCPESEDSNKNYQDFRNEDFKIRRGEKDWRRKVYVQKQQKQHDDSDGSSGDTGDDDVDEDDDYEDDYEGSEGGGSSNNEHDHGLTLDEKMDGHWEGKSRGMANAMSRILGGQLIFRPPSSSNSANQATTSKTATTKPVILSKTKTPLQCLQQKIKTEERDLRQKHQNRRAQNLSAMRLPLAPMAGVSAERLWRQNKKKTKRKRDNDDYPEEGRETCKNDDTVAIVNEIDSERGYRRIATRGVVALFNAISVHRAVVVSETMARENEKRCSREAGRRLAEKKSDDSGGVSYETTKHGFLAMIKKSAGTGVPACGRSSWDNAYDVRKEQVELRGSRVYESKVEPLKLKDPKPYIGWSALKDDFMMNSKLKDWDKEVVGDSDMD